MIKKITLPFIGLFLLWSMPSVSQDLKFVRKILDTLCSPYMAGRGYVNRGDLHAATYIADQFHQIGLESMGSGFFQNYNFPINSFPGNVLIQVDTTILKPAVDFVVAASSEKIIGQYDLVWMTDTSLTVEMIAEKIKGMDLKKKFLVLEKAPELMRNAVLKNVLGVILLRDNNLIWSVSSGGKTREMVAIEMMRDKLPVGTKKISLNIENRFFKKYRTQNVIGFIKGKEIPDTFLVYTAHYDHLGMMGKNALFPGANDNASGTAMLLDLARYYSQPGNQPKYSIAFMAFSGEEAGLHGSKYYVKHPLFSLKKIKFLTNLDMVGTGSDGIGIVNANFYGKEMDLLESINKEGQHMKEIKRRGESAHSDHHPFYQKGVKAVFIYTFGDNYKDYHNINDRASRLPLTGYENFFRLITRFYTQF
ncbi:MAG: M28 family metallopeptidase [Bacteroidales bacterium]